jgi:signal transduction histidine kinase
MRSFLGVPILLRGTAYGNLYLTEKAGGEEFTQEDEEVVNLLASQAAVAVENARLYESATRWLRQLESLNEVGNALAEEIDLPRLLDLVASRLRELISARLVMIVLPEPDGRLSVEAMADGDSVTKVLEMHLLPEGSKTGYVLRRRRSERVDSLIDDPEVDQQAIRILGARTGLWVPLIVGDEAIGVIVAHDKVGPDPRFGDDDLRLAENFAARASVAVNLSKRVARDALRRVLEAQELERRRLSRELHDETGQQLTSILLGLRAVEEAKSADEAREAAAALREMIVTTLQDVRRLAVDLRPKALDDFGLVPALQRLAEVFTEQTGIAADIAARLTDDRLPGEIETMLYRVAQEALTNVVKHARARSVSILLTSRNGGVALVIEDDGVGLTPGRVREDALGLVGMRERVALVGGRIEFESGPDAGTSIRIEVPLP